MTRWFVMEVYDTIEQPYRILGLQVCDVPNGFSTESKVLYLTSEVFVVGTISHYRSRKQSKIKVLTHNAISIGKKLFKEVFDFHRSPC